MLSGSLLVDKTKQMVPYQPVDLGGVPFDLNTSDQVPALTSGLKCCGRVGNNFLLKSCFAYFLVNNIFLVKDERQMQRMLSEITLQYTRIYRKKKNIMLFHLEFVIFDFKIPVLFCFFLEKTPWSAYCSCSLGKFPLFNSGFKGRIC